MSCYPDEIKAVHGRIIRAARNLLTFEGTHGWDELREAFEELDGLNEAGHHRLPDENEG